MEKVKGVFTGIAIKWNNRGLQSFTCLASLVKIFCNLSLPLHSISVIGKSCCVLCYGPCVYSYNTCVRGILVDFVV